MVWGLEGSNEWDMMYEASMTKVDNYEVWESMLNTASLQLIEEQ